MVLFGFRFVFVGDSCHGQATPGHLLNHVSCCSRGRQKAKKGSLPPKAKKEPLLLPKGQEGAAAEELVVAEGLPAARRLPRSPRMIEVCCLVKKWDRVAQGSSLHIGLHLSELVLALFCPMGFCKKFRETLFLQP
jgi:hypothetical protein